MGSQDFPDLDKVLWPTDEVDPQPDREQPHPTTLSDQQFQQSNNILPPLPDGVGESWGHNSNFGQPPLAFDNLDTLPGFVSADNLQNVNIVDLPGQQPQATTLEEYQQWDLSAEIPQIDWHSPLQQTAMQNPANQDMMDI